MAQGVVVRKRNLHPGTKVKTGCATCRTRKVKCDEDKPFCQKCVKTGRTCDGYSTPFRSYAGQSFSSTHMCTIGLDASLQAIQPTWTEITLNDIDLLSRYFSIKTIFNVDLGCDDEAKQVLQASLTDSSIRYAVSSLRALREDFETSGDYPACVSQQTSNYNFGLQQYSMALRGLASNLSSSNFSAIRSALLCCQLFISIEQMQRNYTAMAQHIIRGLGIMQQYRALPELTVANEPVPAHHDQLPLLDVFIIKLFAAPCKFAEPPATIDASGKSTPSRALSPPHQSAGSQQLRTIAPDVRTELTRIATSTLEFLGSVSRLGSAENVLRLSSEKVALLDSLESWLTNLDFVQAEVELPEPVSTSFLRVFHSILKIVLVGTLNFSSNVRAELQTEGDRLQSVADSISERLRSYRMCNGSSSAGRERSKLR